MPALPLIFTSGWASGINSYAVVLMLGLLGRYGHMSAVPPGLQRTDVLAAAALLFAAQFVAGKIPYLDSVWDVLHTAVRPAVGAVIGVLLAQHAHSSTAQAAGSAGIAGGTALVTHLVKTGVRMGINTSPEPVSNIIASLLEDLTVAGLVTLALLHPVIAAVIAAVLLILGVALVALLATRIRRAWRLRRDRRLLRQQGRPRTGQDPVLPP